MIMVPNNLSGIDDRMYDRPMEVDFDRNAPSHNTFGNGPHKCVGAHLARAEIDVFLEEFMTRIPEFRLDPERKNIEHCGSVPGFDRSEERRVGKECVSTFRSWWSPSHSKKTQTPESIQEDRYERREK